MFNKLILVQNVQLGHFEWFLSFIYYTFLRRKLDVQTFERFEEDHDLTQKQIAKILSFTNSAYAKIEQGEHTLTADVLVTLSNFYDVSTDYLLELTDFPDKIRFRK